MVLSFKFFEKYFIYDYGRSFQYFYDSYVIFYLNMSKIKKVVLRCDVIERSLK